MQRNMLETLTGAAVLACAGIFALFAYKNSDRSTGDGYHVTARFTNIAGISTGSDVRVGGIKVGLVDALTLDAASYNAVANLRIRQDVKLPEDSNAAIVSSGLLGEKFISLTPGADEAMLADGGRIDYTQPAVSLEELIGKFMFSGGGVDKNKPAADKAASTPETLNP